MDDIPASSTPNPSSSVNPGGAAAEEKYKGVRGWLLLFCIGLTILAPIRAVFEAFSSYDLFSPHFRTVSNLEVFWLVLTALNLGMALYACVAGMNLWNVRPGAVEGAKRFLWCLLVFSIGAMFLPVVFGLSVAAVAYVKPAGILTFLIWFFYLKKSKRVKATYGASPGA